MVNYPSCDNESIRRLFEDAMTVEFTAVFRRVPEGGSRPPRPPTLSIAAPDHLPRAQLPGQKSIRRGPFFSSLLSRVHRRSGCAAREAGRNAGAGDTVSLRS